MCAVHLLVRRAESDGDSLLVQQLAAFALRHQGTSAAGSIKEAGIDLAVTGQPGEQPCPLLQRERQDLHDLNARHVPSLLHCLRALNPIYSVNQTQKLSVDVWQVAVWGPCMLECVQHLACWQCCWRARSILAMYSHLPQITKSVMRLLMTYTSKH